MNTKIPNSKLTLTRRRFLQTAALATGAATFGFPALLRGQNLNNKLNVAFIGAGGKGAGDTDCCAAENIVALCDADRNNCAAQLKKYPNAKFYQDFRKMFEEMGKSIDAVNVATPDHFHTVAAAAAIRLGKHVYCQKPLAQTVYEVRLLRDLAKSHKVVTQMGNQGSAEDGLRRAVECIQAGIIGPVRQVHVWSNRPIWPQGTRRPEGSDPVPEGMDWDLWLGPAAVRPFKKGVYHTFNWRGFLDFGTGALGDMACHTVNMPFRALQLGYPTTVEAESSGMNGETYPLASKIRFEYPTRDASASSSPALPPVTLWWYDGGKPTANNPTRHDGSNKPPAEVTAEVQAFRGEVPGSGCLIIGDKGVIFSPDDYGTQFFIKLKEDAQFLNSSRHPAAQPIPLTLPRNQFRDPTDPQRRVDSDRRHHLEWIAAIKQNQPELCYSRFDVSGYLAETMLLGCVALRVGKKLEWDGPGMRANNVPEAERFVKRDNRAGWPA